VDDVVVVEVDVSLAPPADVVVEVVVGSSAVLDVDVAGVSVGVVVVDVPVSAVLLGSAVLLVPVVLLLALCVRLPATLLIWLLTLLAPAPEPQPAARSAQAATSAAPAVQLRSVMSIGSSGAEAVHHPIGMSAVTGLQCRERATAVRERRRRSPCRCLRRCGLVFCAPKAGVHRLRMWHAPPLWLDSAQS
jgi:hypothetical protein